MNRIRAFINSKMIQRLKRFLAVKTGFYFRFKLISPSVSEFMRISYLLQHYGVTKVIDVGANTGQFAESLIDFGYKGKIVSFEPVSSAYKGLKKRANRYRDWIVAERCAIGNYVGNVVINVSDVTVFSSIKNIKQGFVASESTATVLTTEQVPIMTLDSLLGKYYDQNDVIFLKVDTQGFEKEVLEGASNLLKWVKGVTLEVPISTDKDIYEGVENDLKDYMDFFISEGFELVSIEQLGADKKTGIVHEVDVVFFRK